MTNLKTNMKMNSLRLFFCRCSSFEKRIYHKNERLHANDNEHITQHKISNEK